jgi:benzylsuccinate CoA-transferase BbsE subunit
VSGPHTDLVVVEFCDQLGQLAGKLLADMGADVIKIESPEGSAARTVGPFAGREADSERSLNFWYHNTNKRSFVADLDDAESVAEVRGLCDRANLVIEDRAPGMMGRFGLDYEMLMRSNPALVYCSITPFGQTGPWANWKVNDLVALALGGPMMMNGYDLGQYPEAPPIHGNGDQAFNTACHYAVHGIMAAILYRDRSGEGQYVDCAMHEALSCTVEVGMPYWLYMRRDVRRQTGRHAAAVATERWIYHAADGRDVLVFGVGRNNSQWNSLKKWLQAAGFGQHLDEERFSDPLARQPARGTPEAKEIMATVSAFIGETGSDEVYRGAQARGLPWGVVLAPEEVMEDPHWHDRSFYVQLPEETLQTPVLMPGAPYQFSATPWEIRRRAPRLGEHTEEIRASMRG